MFVDLGDHAASPIRNAKSIHKLEMSQKYMDVPSPTHRMLHSIRVCMICLDRSTISWDVEHSNFIVVNKMEDSISQKGLKQISRHKGHLLRQPGVIRGQKFHSSARNYK